MRVELAHRSVGIETGRRSNKLRSLRVIQLVNGERGRGRGGEGEREAEGGRGERGDY